MRSVEVVATKALFDHPWVLIIRDTLEYRLVPRPYQYLASPVEAVATAGSTAASKVRTGVMNWKSCSC